MTFPLILRCIRSLKLARPTCTANATKFSWPIQGIQATAEPVNPPIGEPDPDDVGIKVVDKGTTNSYLLALILVLTASAFIPYHPKVDGPLTMKLLKKITQRECYQRMGFNEMIVAAYVGDESLVKKLLQQGHNPNETDVKRRSAIWWGRNGWVPELWHNVLEHEIFSSIRMFLLPPFIHSLPTQVTVTNIQLCKIVQMLKIVLQLAQGLDKEDRKVIIDRLRNCCAEKDLRTLVDIFSRMSLQSDRSIKTELLGTHPQVRDEHLTVPQIAEFQFWIPGPRQWRQSRGLKKRLL